MAEVAPSAGGSGGNRNFLLIIGGLGALVILGLLALGAILFLPALFGDGSTNVAGITATPTRISIPPTPTRTAQPTATPVVVAQNTAAIPTATEVIVPLEETATPIEITATPILITATPGPGGAVAGVTPEKGGQPSQNELPNSGLGEDLMLLFGGGVLLGVIFIVRRMRAA
jgi:hypothetical protein